jgi:hypothetical protein
VELDVRTQTRPADPIEVAAYYVVSEALTNTTKHARASCAHVAVEQRDGLLHLSIRDDGVGGADPAAGSGLIGLRDRVQALGGSIEVDSPPEPGQRSSSSFHCSPTDARPARRCQGLCREASWPRGITTARRLSWGPTSLALLTTPEGRAQLMHESKGAVIGMVARSARSADSGMRTVLTERLPALRVHAGRGDRWCRQS